MMIVRKILSLHYIQSEPLFQLSVMEKFLFYNSRACTGDVSATLSFKAMTSCVLLPSGNGTMQFERQVV